MTALKFLNSPMKALPVWVEVKVSRLNSGMIFQFPVTAASDFVCVEAPELSLDAPVESDLFPQAANSRTEATTTRAFIMFVVPEFL